MVTLCQVCQKREASVFLMTTIHASEAERESEIQQKQSFCRSCADAYYASTPGMNSARDLIRLSDSYRSELYDLLDATHSEAFDNHDSEACRRSSEPMCGFLRKQLKKDRMDIRGDAYRYALSGLFGVAPLLFQAK
jgi:protein-arginine kinase activator protein McsA